MRHDYFETTENGRLACRCGRTFDTWTALTAHFAIVIEEEL